MDEVGDAAHSEGRPEDTKALGRGPVGGAAGEVGSVHRAGIAAIAVAAGLRGDPAEMLAMSSAPVGISLEVASEIDDLEVLLEDDTHVYIQAKASADMGKALKETVQQWAAAAKTGGLRDGDLAVMAVGRPSNTLADLGTALDARRSNAVLTTGQAEALKKLEGLLSEADLDPGQAASLMDVAFIRTVDGRSGSPAMEAAAAWLDGAVVETGQGRAAASAIAQRIPQLAAEHGTAAIADWRAWLRDAHLPAHADPHGVRAAREQAIDSAIAQRRAELAGTLDFLPLASLVPAEPLHVPRLAADLRVKRSAPKPDTRASSTRESDVLLHLLRREGRLLLVGQPGSGKSVAMRQMAAHLGRV